jgi:hypothetical protein
MYNVRNYEELQRFVKAFAEGRINVLVICSPGGLGKSELVRAATGHLDVVFVGGHVTPLALYELLEQGRDKPVVFDEIDGLLGDRKHVGLLKQLCETSPSKRIQWASSSRRADEVAGGVESFQTSSRVLILCNSFKALDENVAALSTRAIIVQFTPSAEEILAQIASFATDAEVLGFLEEFGGAMRDLSLRSYVKLAELKSAGIEWRPLALQEVGVPEKVVVLADLLEQFDSDVERLKKYPGSRRDFYNHKREAEAFLMRRNARQRSRIQEVALAG